MNWRSGASSIRSGQSGQLRELMRRPAAHELQGVWGNLEVPPQDKRRGLVGETWFPPRERAEGARRSRRKGTLRPVQRRLVLPMVVVVLAIWLLGTWVTKYSLEEMALYTPIAVAALGALAGVILLWVKIVRESLRRRGTAHE